MMPEEKEPDEPFEVINREGDPTLLLVCDHASNYIPPEYESLGLPREQVNRHIGYDIGAASVTRKLSRIMGAPAVLSHFSRLLIDPNRGEDDPTLMMRISDGAIIPGNRHADNAEIERRLERFYRPYHAAVDRQIDLMEGPVTGPRGRRSQPVILSVHSFTPHWKGRTRPWEYGILYAEEDDRLARSLLRQLRREPGLLVGDNEPYRGALINDSMHKHGFNRGLPHAVVEIRQDLINNERGAERAARLMHRVMMRVLEDMRVMSEQKSASVHRLRA
ncbi:MAG: N-formylglutamate amidohydrolase [Alphaproteobacteria bacterium]